MIALLLVVVVLRNLRAARNVLGTAFAGLGLGRPQDDATRALVDRLRSEAIPAALRDTAATAYVGGRTARFGDEAEKIASPLPVFAAAVVGLSLLLLLAVFGSWRVSFLSAVFNLASIAAAYGVVALAFQTQTGTELLGVEQLPVVPYVPLCMFAILFGLRPTTTCSCSRASARSGAGIATTATRSRPPRPQRGRSSALRAPS